MDSKESLRACFWWMYFISLYCRIQIWKKREFYELFNLKIYRLGLQMGADSRRMTFMNAIFGVYFPLFCIFLDSEVALLGISFRINLMGV